MISIRIPEGQPELEVAPDLMTSLAVFDFDHERYIDGLTLAGVPQPAIDSLAVQFNKGVSGAGSGAVYNGHNHRVRVLVAGPDYDASASTRPIWENSLRSPSMEINFALAATAMKMSDTVLRHPDVLSISRANPNPPGKLKGQLLSLTSLTLTGSVIGAAVGAASKRPWEASLIGGGIGAFTDSFLVTLSELTPSRRRTNKEVSSRHDRINARALKFARSRDAKDIFSKVVQVELL